MVRRASFAAAVSSPGAVRSIRSVEITAAGHVEVVDRPAPQGPPAAGQVRVRMRAVGICGTDLSLAAGSRTPPELPWRLGHEGIGEIAEVGPGVEGWAIGDGVALEPNITCGQCEYCRRGVTSACASRLSAGVLTQPGFLAEVVDHPSEFCHRLPAGIPVERAVCAEPLTVASAAIRRTELRGGEDVLVIGAGAQGLLATLILVDRGYRPWVSEPDAARLQLATELGARAFVPGRSPAPEVVIDAAGVPEGLAAVVDHLAPFAKVTIVGEDQHHLGASSFHIVQRQLNIRGSFIYEHPQDMATAVELLKRLPTEAIVGPGRSLDEVPELLGARSGGIDSVAGGARQPGSAGGSRRPGVKQWVDLRG
ncbi:zinc-dependent alcohol dehydrogenase [Brevibacterium spongiae]|uniref:Alcohol dehydrogenase catalytic domain-containing protein n=1 Tax=Brevibacterium spongiae TaxID=2909672 RepID=A0ABY5SLK4_9MICO|nr:alcohol dehydrogenase catalytic domain-containing protein [Brevibacterium spongiae]UVI35417.1 alcohol dehydrogenase catalytic domain-containing protein [Brevibacterium spongiae]